MDLMDFEATGLGVLVGVDGSPGGTAALVFAAEEASLRRRPLTVCHVGSGAAPGQGDPILDDAEARLARSALGVTVRPLAQVGHPADVLATLAADAVLTVVGSRGRGGVVGLMLGSVGLNLSIRAPGPVVVVRPSPPAVGWAGTFAGHVVVGVDGSAGSTAALEFGFAEAERRNRPLAAVHVHRLAPADTYVDDRTLELHAEERDPGRDLLDAAVDPWAARYPRVQVKRALHHGSPAAGLLRAAGGAVLLAVGRTGRSAPAGVLFGSVSQAMTHRGPCPVAVVPAATPVH
ncbi:MAG TPA: universal stress protein [Mycobacteriales bacterium]|jgi:Universal stress protein UspA and related nucleotide-binding proteins